MPSSATYVTQDDTLHWNPATEMGKLNDFAWGLRDDDCLPDTARFFIPQYWVRFRYLNVPTIKAWLVGNMKGRWRVNSDRNTVVFENKADATHTYLTLLDTDG